MTCPAAMSTESHTPAHIRVLLSLVAALLLGCAHEPTGPPASRPAPEKKSIEHKEITPKSSAEGERDQANMDDTQTESPSTFDTTDTDRARDLTISLANQEFTYREAGEVVRIGPISSGAKGYKTPSGRFSVLSKDEDKVSSRYTNQLGMQAWMPYSIQFHGNYFLHEGWLPGYPDSHGCIRVGEKDARFLFERMRIGDPIEVVK